MDYFNKFLRSGSANAPVPIDHNAEFHKSWLIVKNTLLYPDERQLAKGIQATDVPRHLKSMVDSLVWESTKTEEGATGACLEYLLKNDVLGTLVQLSEPDRPSGIQAEVLRTVQNMVVLLDEQFLVHSAVHRAVLRLLRTCVGDNIQEELDGRSRVMGAAGTAARRSRSDYEEDLVDLLCVLCSRIRTYRELLMIFFHDHQQHAPLPSDDVEDRIDIDTDSDEEDSQSTLAESKSHSRPSSPTGSQNTVTNTSASKKIDQEFILFNYLLRFSHREGKIGELARAGLLFLIDVALTSDGTIHRLVDEDYQTARRAYEDPAEEAALSLAEYILDGDFSEVLGAGLGAVYSLLPSKLYVQSIPQTDLKAGNVAQVGITNLDTLQDDIKAGQQTARDLGMEVSSNPEFKGRVDHFLKLLEFLQDVLRRNSRGDTHSTQLDPLGLLRSAISDSVVDAARGIFLENVLYPSILECSDIDGSAVAVMSYIDVMIRTLQGGQLARSFVDFLANDDDSDSPRRARHQATVELGRPESDQNDTNAKIRRRKSSAMMLLEMEAPDAQRQSEYLTSLGRFTLKDLLLSNLKSPSERVVISAMQMLQSLLAYHCSVTTDKILIVTEEYSGNSDVDQVSTSFATHERELAMYLDLLSQSASSYSDDSISTSYNHYLSDAILTLQTHCNDNQEDLACRKKYQLNPHEPLLSRLLQHLRSFFTNTPELNIVLTSVLAQLAMCSNRSLSGWLTFTPGPTTPPSLEPLDGAEIIASDSLEFENIAKAHSQYSSLSNSQSLPVLFSTFRKLFRQLPQYRRHVLNFDRYLSERRNGLSFSERLSDALNVSLDADADFLRSVVPGSTSYDASPQSTPSKKSKLKASSWTALLTPKKKSSPRKPVTSPEEDRSVAAAADTSPFKSHYRETTAISVEAIQPSNDGSDAQHNLDMFSPGWSANPIPSELSTPGQSHAGGSGGKQLNLSQLLDNVVILEECIKELTAILHARRCVGIDSVSLL